MYVYTHFLSNILVVTATVLTQIIYTVGTVLNIRQRNRTHESQTEVVVSRTLAHTTKDRAKINANADKHYNAERDYRQRVVDKHIRESKLVVGSLAMLQVARALRVSRVHSGCKSFPVIIENILNDGRMFAVKAKFALIKERIRREDLILRVNEILRTEIETSPLRSFDRLTIREYLNSYWITPVQAPHCRCTGGCARQSCPCRVSGFKCGADCHPVYYERHGCCKNYK